MKKNYYTGVGLTVGTGIAAALAMLLYSLTGNAIFLAFIGLGTAMGLIFGYSIDKRKGN